MQNESLYLKINPKWEHLVFPLIARDREQLYKELNDYGCRRTIKVWNLYVLCDFECYEYCKKNDIPFTIEHIKARNMEEALLWICKHQLETRKILPEEMKKYLIGKRYLLERVLGAHSYMEAKKTAYKNPKYKQKIGESKYDETATSTRQRIGATYNISYITVRKYGIFAEMIDTLLEVAPDFAKSIISGAIRISHENLEVIMSLPPAEIKTAANKIMTDQKNNKNYSAPREILHQTPSFENKVSILTGRSTIKTMPKYDPDAELTSLTYTIPTWVSSINRALSVADMSKVSAIAKSRLNKELIELRKIVDRMLYEIKE